LEELSWGSVTYLIWSHGHPQELPLWPYIATGEVYQLSREGGDVNVGGLLLDP